MSQWNPSRAFSSAKYSSMNIEPMTDTIAGSPASIDAGRLRGRNRDRSTLACRRGVCATSQPLAALAGVDVLKSGGNAIDAAVAMSAMMGVVEPMSCGPGGDLFAIVWIEKDKKLYGLNASGRSPFEWNLERARSRGYTDSLPELGPHTWSVPGCVSGWDALQKRFGKLTFKDVLSPAAQYAMEGFVVTEIIGGYFRGSDESFREFPNAAQTYLKDGKPPKYGQVFANPDMARFYETLIRGGADEFYRGEIAERIVNYSKERGGYFTLRDFEEHSADWVEPACANYRGCDVWEIPPNGQGIAALQMLNMLGEFDIGALTPNSAEHLHLFIEAKKLAFEDRAVYYADMEHADVPLEWLISKEYGRERAKLIDPKRAAVNVKPGELDGSRDTIYLCAADGEGNMVSLIQSIYWGFGSREVPTGLGFCLQNRGRAFNLDPRHRNALEPHKRPFHTIIPGFLTREGRPKCAFGVMGGDMQPQGHAQVLMNLIDFHMSPQQAGEQPRAQHFGSTDPWGQKKSGGGSVGLEAEIPEETAKRLEEMGHQIASTGTGMYGGYQAIWREEEPMRYFAGSDPRKDGCAIGY
ncbi:MAG: gamma-glutamyltransferase family protein [Candidatus Omnitrophica bacterium]|nr:gamma-glutamyltransferase family protein [Candidatus Omnitrophota bacterium]